MQVEVNGVFSLSAAVVSVAPRREEKAQEYTERRFFWFWLAAVAVSVSE